MEQRAGALCGVPVMLLWGSEQAVTQWDVKHVDVELGVVCVNMWGSLGLRWPLGSCCCSQRGCRAGVGSRALPTALVSARACSGLWPLLSWAPLCSEIHLSLPHPGLILWFCPSSPDCTEDSCRALCAKLEKLPFSECCSKHLKNVILCLVRNLLSPLLQNGSRSQNNLFAACN